MTSLQQTILDVLRAELAQYEASKARAAELLGDQPDYLIQVLAGWDMQIARVKGQIERELARGRPSGGPVG